MAYLHLCKRSGILVSIKTEETVIKKWGKTLETLAPIGGALRTTTKT